MTVLTVLALVGIFYSLLYLADSVLRTNPSTCSRYLLTLRRLGLEVSLLSLRVSTTRYNSSLQSLAELRPSLTKLWFSLGGLVSSLLLLPSCLLLLLSLYQHLQPSQPSQPVLQPVLPGVNLPPSQLLHYLLALLLASLYHEAGHALAAFNCNLRMSSAGLMVVAVFPAAFVELPTAELESRTAWQQLRVYSGGVWHNTVMACTASLLSLLLPCLLSPLYSTGRGLTVTGVAPGSSVRGPSGLEPGQVMTGLQGRDLTSRREFARLVASLVSEPQAGLCVREEEVASLSPCLSLTGSSSLACCPADRPDCLCFSSQNSPARCLPVRPLVARGGGWCGETCEGGGWCGKTCEDGGLQCWTPRLESNNTNLLVITRREERDFLYIGSPAVLYSELTVSQFVPQFSWLPLTAPDTLLTFLSHLSAFSAGLAVLNVVPSYLLDGQHILRVLVEIFFRHQTERTRLTVTAGLTLLGSLLIALNIVLGLASLSTKPLL